MPAETSARQASGAAAPLTLSPTTWASEPATHPAAEAEAAAVAALDDQVKRDLQRSINMLKAALQAGIEQYGPDHPRVKSLLRRVDAYEQEILREQR